MENSKELLDNIASKLNIKKPNDWGEITVHRFRKVGGQTLLNYYGCSIYSCVQSIYKDIDWKKEWFATRTRNPLSYWKSLENRKKFLDKIAAKLNIKDPKEWGKVSSRQLISLGGDSLLRIYGSSLFLCLKSIYKDIEWKKEWFSYIKHELRYPKTYWKHFETRKQLMDEIARKLNIKEPKEWGKVTTRKITALGGGIVLKYYNGSLLKCLKSLYPNIQWKKEWFPNIPLYPYPHWESMENRRKFLDKVATSLKLKNPRDWGRITVCQIYEYGGSSLLNKYYNGSLFACLQSIYKDMDWKREWFSNIPKYPKSHWNSISNCREFMDQLSLVSNIQAPAEWRKVTQSLIINRGGSGLLNKYQGSIKKILKSLYSYVDWNHLLIYSNNRGNISTEMRLQGSLNQIFPNEYIFPRFRKQLHH